MRTRRVPLSILILIFGATMLLAGAVYIELSREVTDAIVLSKRERVVPDLSGTTWSQQPEVLVRYQIDHRLYEGWTRMSSSQYDTVHRRDTIRVSYATINPEWVRPAGRSVFTSIVYRVQPWQSFTWLMLIVGLVYLATRHFRGGVVRWWTRKRPPARRALLTVTVLVWVVVVTSGYTPPPWQAFFGQEREQRAEARIRDVRPVTQFGGGNRENPDALPIGLPQGFERVELVFIPERLDDAVVAVDEVDEASAGELRAGMSVPVVHVPGQPRTARLVAGERSHLWKNPLIIQGIVLGVAAGLLSIPFAWRWYRGG